MPESVLVLVLLSAAPTPVVPLRCTETEMITSSDQHLMSIEASASDTAHMHATAAEHCLIAHPVYALMHTLCSLGMTACLPIRKSSVPHNFGSGEHASD